MTALSTPPPLETIWVTYKKVFGCGPYGDTKRIETITRRGFYDPNFNKVSVPPEWRVFDGVLLPHGFGGDHLTLDKVINWELA